MTNCIESTRTAGVYAEPCTCPTHEGVDPEVAAVMRLLIAVERRLAELDGRRYDGEDCPHAVDTPESLAMAQATVTAGDVPTTQAQEILDLVERLVAR